MRRSYKGAANRVQLTNVLGGSTDDLTIETTTMNNWPDGLIGPFFIVIDRDLFTEEKILCATKSGNTLTVYDDGVVNGRGADGTSVTSHASGAFVEHVFTATDADQANLHVNTNPLHVLTITFATRPASPAVGQIIYQTDTAEYFSWDGSAWTVFAGIPTAYSAKGDLIVGTGVDTDAILSVGADNTVLTADSTTTTGTKWAASGGGGIDIPATRVDAVVQTLDGSTWSEGMALSVSDTVPADTEGQVGDVVFVTGPSPGNIQGKILQVVRATDSTTRSTTSTSYSDTGLSVTITPTKNDSAIILIATCLVILSSSTVNDLRGYVTVTDNSNNMISGAQDVRLGPKDLTSSGSAEVWLSPTVMGYSTPATTSATTYKTRFRANTVNASITLQNTTQTAQLFAIEVSA